MSSRLLRTAVAAMMLLVPCMSAQRVEAQEHALWGSLRPGQHDVGFRRIWTFDETRAWPRSRALDSLTGNVARPLRIDIWYPATCEGPPMSLRGYVEMEAPDPAFKDLVSQTHVLDDWSYHGLAGDSASYDRLMAAPTAACPGAPGAGGRYPLVLYSAGWFNRAPDNTVLAEYLASHGYVVATVPQLNPGLWSYDFHSDPVSVENQTRDLEAALGVLGKQPDVDRTRVAAMGYSTGGDVALLLADRSPLIDAVVGLDASWSLSGDNDVTTSSLFRPDRHAEPVLVLRRRPDEAAPGDSALEQLSGAPRLVIEIPGADHGSFSDDPPERVFLGDDTEGDPTIHAVIARAALDFLDAVLGPSRGFDGSRLADRYRAQGLQVTFRPATEVNAAEDL